MTAGTIRQGGMETRPVGSGNETAKNKVSS